MKNPFKSLVEAAKEKTESILNVDITNPGAANLRRKAWDIVREKTAVEQIANRKIETSDQVIDAIFDLEQIGTAEASGAIMGFFTLPKYLGLDESAVYRDHDKYDAAEYDEMVRAAFDSLEEMEDGAFALSWIVCNEKKYFDELGDRFKRMERYKYLNPKMDTHEKEAVNYLSIIGGDDAALVLGQAMGKLYPKESIKALRNIDSKHTPKSIENISKVDFSKGIEPRCIKGLEAMVELRRHVAIYDNSNMSIESICDATHNLTSALLDAEPMLNCLGGRKQIAGGIRGAQLDCCNGEKVGNLYSERGGYYQPEDAKPMSKKKIGKLQEVFSDIDGKALLLSSGNLDRDVVICKDDFDKILDLHQRNLIIEQDLDELRA